jgi:hypothetical protein
LAASVVVVSSGNVVVDSATITGNVSATFVSSPPQAFNNEIKPERATTPTTRQLFTSSQRNGILVRNIPYFR